MQLVTQIHVVDVRPHLTSTAQAERYEVKYRRTTLLSIYPVLVMHHHQMAALSKLSAIGNLTLSYFVNDHMKKGSPKRLPQLSLYESEC